MQENKLVFFELLKTNYSDIFVIMTRITALFNGKPSLEISTKMAGRLAVSNRERKRKEVKMFSPVDCA